MIAANTSTLVTFLEGESGKDVQSLNKASEDRHVVVLPVVLDELMSDPTLPEQVAQYLPEVSLVGIQSGQWQRVGILRAMVLVKPHKARLGGALIASTCVDEDLPLMTRDRKFLAFAEGAKLGLIIGPSAIGPRAT